MASPGDSSVLAAVEMDADYLRENYLFGLRLADEQGNPFPAGMFQVAIEQAVTITQRLLDVVLVPTRIREYHDYIYRNFSHWNWISLDYYPVLELHAVGAEYPQGAEVISFPESWWSLNRQRGQVQIVPRTGILASVFSGAGQMLLPLLNGTVDNVPDLLFVEYTAGFDKLPADLKHLIALRACIHVLNAAGDLVAGPGIANKTISMPGLHQVIETTASPTNSAYGARILQYRKEADDLLDELRRYYHGARIEVA